MAYDEDLANRLRELLADETVTERKMFGGLTFLLGGHMSVSASGRGGLLARIAPGDTEAALKRPHVSRMEMGGRTMDGWIRVAPEGLKTKRELAAWVKRSVAFVKTLPPEVIWREPQPPRFEDEPEELSEVPGNEVDEARLADVELSGTRVAGLRLSDVVVLRGNLANLAAPELVLNRVTLTGTRLTGASWTRGELTDVAFRDCRIDLATFAGTTFERVTFDGCMLTQTDFREALLRSVRFSYCDLTEADLQGLRLDRCELRSCTLDALAGVERLRGAGMPASDIIGNADLFAAALGIRVLEE